MDGHIASSAHLVAVHHNLQHALRYSASSQVWPARRWFVKQFRDAIVTWASRNKLPFHPVEHCDELLDEHWPLHLEALSRSSTPSFQDLQYLKQTLQDLVVFGQDHEPDHAMIYCPHMFWRMTHDTFFDEKVYKVVDLSIPEATEHVCSLIPDNLRKELPWAWELKKPLPYAYILPKTKKRWTTARPIIAYSDTPIGNGLRAAALILARIIKVVFPDSIEGNLVTLFRLIRTFFDDAPLEQKFSYINDDLVGFFTSIPQDRILDAVKDVLSRYMHMFGADHEHMFPSTLERSNFLDRSSRATSAKNV